MVVCVRACVGQFCVCLSPVTCLPVCLPGRRMDPSDSGGPWYGSRVWMAGEGQAIEGKAVRQEQVQLGERGEATNARVQMARLAHRYRRR